MSGQPVKTQSDVNKFKNEYLETLALQESINDMNLQANKTYLLTGQLPPQSQMQDTRTTAEKLADVEKLKQDIASNLAPIAEPQLAYAIVSKVMDSPLNIDNTLLRFLAQRAPSLAEQLKRILPYGIAGDANDIETIVNFIKNMYSEQQGKFQSTKSFLNSTSSIGSSKSSVLSANDLDSLLLQIQDIMKNTIMLSDSDSKDILTKVFYILFELKSVIPTTNQIKIMLNDMENLESIGEMSFGQLRGFYEILEKIPPYGEVMSLIKKIDRNIKTGNKKLVKNGCENLLKLFSGLDLPDNLYELYSDFKQYLSDKEKMQNNIEIDKMYKVERDMKKQDEITSKAQKVYIINPESDPVWVRGNQILGSSQGNSQNVSIPTYNQVVNNEPSDNNNEPSNVPIAGPISKMPFLSSELKSLTIDDIRLLANKIIGNPLFDTPIIISQYNRGGINPYEDALDRLKDIINGKSYPLPILTQSLMTILNSNPKYNPSTIPPTNPLGVKGLGIKRRVGRPRGSGMPKVVVPRIPNFVGFGVSEINQKSLAKGILSVRRNTRTNYPEMPSRRISDNMKNIVKTMIGGGVPKYEDLGKLDNDEKEYLHKLVSKSEMNDRLSVPAPSKDQQEKDIHNFEVLKGQILSGNDSQDLVKKFKLLIRKLSKQGLLPRAQVDDLLDTLVDLGY